MDDVVESPDPASTSSVSPLECTYSITVYAGYGVEIQVKCFSLGTAGIIIANIFQRRFFLHIIQEVITQTTMLIGDYFCCLAHQVFAINTLVNMYFAVGEEGEPF